MIKLASISPPRFVKLSLISSYTRARARGLDKKLLRKV